MISESKTVEIINKYLKGVPNSTECRYYPAASSDLDKAYEDNECGAEIQEAITFLASCNGKV